MNPFLNHRLESISLNSISKWRARVLPSFKDYYARYGRIAPNLTIGFSYLMALYSAVEKQGEKYFVNVSGRTIELKDDSLYLEHFAKKMSVKEFMSDANIWGEELKANAGFAEAVLSNIQKIREGVCLI